VHILIQRLKQKEIKVLLANMIFILVKKNKGTLNGFVFLSVDAILNAPSPSCTFKCIYSFRVESERKLKFILSGEQE